MSPKIRKFLLFVGIALFGCCLCSTTLLFITPTNEEPATYIAARVIEEEIDEASNPADTRPTATHTTQPTAASRPTNLSATSPSLTTQEPIVTKLIVTNAPANLTATH